jgi:arsenite methyltransferase
MNPEVDARSECKPDAKRDSAQPQDRAEPSADVKSCCARLYESDLVRLLLGGSFHPGGLRLTSKLGELLKVTRESRVLDVACGKGTSVIHLADTLGCEVVGVDYSEENVRQAAEAAQERGIAPRARFERGDSEQLRFDNASFDAIICECAFCTFPDKVAAAAEFVRVLRPGGRVGLSDIVRARELPPELKNLMSWLACIADARPAEEYAALLIDAGLQVDCIETHDNALVEMVHQIQGRLLGLEIAVGLKKLEIPGVDFGSAKELAQAALHAVRQRQLGYALIIAQLAL